MGYTLKSVPTCDNSLLYEKACENYKCECCNAGMISVNFVNGVCIQVFVTHKEGCRNSGSLTTRTVDATCESCSFFDCKNIKCTFSGRGNQRIGEMHS